MYQEKLPAKLKAGSRRLFEEIGPGTSSEAMTPSRYVETFQGVKIYLRPDRWLQASIGRRLVVDRNLETIHRVIEHHQNAVRVFRTEFGRPPEELYIADVYHRGRRCGLRALGRVRLDDRFECDWCYLWDEEIVQELERLCEEFRQLQQQYSDRYERVMRRAVRLRVEDVERLKAGAAVDAAPGLAAGTGADS